MAGRTTTARLQRDRNRNRLLKQRYGITLEQYHDILERQGGKCAICRGGSTMALSVDHNHANLRVRGLLCKPCNRILGHWRDDYEKPLRAADYLLDDGRRIEDLVAV